MPIKVLLCCIRIRLSRRVPLRGFRSHERLDAVGNVAGSSCRLSAWLVADVTARSGIGPVCDDYGIADDIRTEGRHEPEPAASLYCGSSPSERTNSRIAQNT